MTCRRPSGRASSNIITSSMVSSKMLLCGCRSGWTLSRFCVRIFLSLNMLLLNVLGAVSPRQLNQVFLFGAFPLPVAALLRCRSCLMMINAVRPTLRLKSRAHVVLLNTRKLCLSVFL